MDGQIKDTLQQRDHFREQFENSQASVFKLKVINQEIKTELEYKNQIIESMKTG